MHTFLWLAALGLVVPAAAGAQQEIKASDAINTAMLRRCVGYIGRGALRTVGKPKDIEVPQGARDDSSINLGGAVHRLRFNEGTALFGQALRKPRTLTLAAHALRQIDIADAVVFLDSDGDLVDFEWVWMDRAGRPFIPIFEWPNPDQRDGWAPLVLRDFAHPVDYRAPQPFWDTMRIDDVAEDPEFFVRGDTHWIVRHGLYLSDIPALMTAAKTENCAR